MLVHIIESIKMGSGTEYPMSIPSYVLTVFTPSILFMIISLPVKKRNIIQESILGLLWFTGLTIPIYYAGQFSYICLMATSVWAWATSMKMGVWVFSMNMEERRQRPFVYTIFNWRKSAIITPKDTTTVVQPRPDEYIDTHLGYLIWTLIKNQVMFDIVDIVFNLCNPQRPVKVFSWFLATLLNGLGQHTKAATLMPSDEEITARGIMISVLMCMLFCVYIQLQLEVICDGIKIAYAMLYKCLPTLERWQLGKDQSKLDTKNIVKTKAILKRVRGIRQVKSYIEGILRMPPLFDSPWSAHSLRDFWGRRWHTIYNECFYRLGYKPIRLVIEFIFDCKPPRWLPALAVFVMSGIMHEYFLYAATGNSIYFGTPLPACGWQFLFFVIQVGMICIGDMFFKGGWLGQAYAITSMSITSHLFVVPYILTGYIYMDRLSLYRVLVHLYQGDFNVLSSVFSK